MEIIIAAVLLVIAAETTYLVGVQTIKLKRTNRQLRPIFVDTSVLIDGRIVSIAESGFITSPLLIPRSVVGELQYLADNADPDKRSRARHGLDVVSHLQEIPRLKVEIFADGTRADEGVDNRLLKLAKKYNGLLCTIDFNLNKVAQVEGIVVLNVNDLAKTLRMAYLPGEKTELELTQKGNDQHQAVGHLADGTMVVVEHAQGKVGQTVEIEFIRSLQTAAGKMMFARLAADGNGAHQRRAERPQTAQKGRQPRSPQTPQTQTPRAPKAPRAPQTPANTQDPARNSQPRRPQNRRPQSNEDRLVELANK